MGAASLSEMPVTIYLSTWYHTPAHLCKIICEYVGCLYIGLQIISHAKAAIIVGLTVFIKSVNTLHENIQTILYKELESKGKQIGFKQLPYLCWNNITANVLQD
jgi:hypothetical protein